MRSEPLVVVHIVGSLQGGGAERCVRDLVPRLRARGARAEIATVYPPNLPPDALASLGCVVHARAKRPGFDPVHCAWLARTLARRRPAIVHTHMQAGKYVGRLAAILAGVPVIIHTEHSPNPVARRERLYAELFWRRTAAVVTFGEENAEIVRAREPVGRVEIIRNGVALGPPPSLAAREDARRRLGLDAATPAFGIVASLQERKNHRLAFEALACLRAEPGPPPRLALFGDGPARDDLVRLAKALGVADLVTWYGFRPDVVALLPGLDVLLSVSRLEMAPIAILEAMAAGLPVVATPHAGTRDMIEDGVTGRIVGWDAAGLADAMRRARDDAAWRAACGAAGRARVERHHDIDSIVDQHLALYRRALARRAAGP